MSEVRKHAAAVRVRLQTARVQLELAEQALDWLQQSGGVAQREGAHVLAAARCVSYALRHAKGAADSMSYAGLEEAE